MFEMPLMQTYVDGLMVVDVMAWGNAGTVAHHQQGLQGMIFHPRSRCK